MKKGKGKIGERDAVDLDAAVTRYARTHPQLGQAKVAAALRAQGVSVSASGVRYIWRKHGLETTFKRLEAIAKSTLRGATLTDGQREIVRRGEVRRKFARKSQARAAAADRGTANARRELILAAAAELFVERGYAGTSMREIAGRVGLLAGSVYHYYPAKENLFLAVQKEGFRQILERVEQAVRGSRDPWQRLELACAEHVHSVVAGNPIARVTATGLFAIHEDALQRHLEHDRDRYEAIFRELVQALDLPPGVDRALFRLALFGALNWTLVWYRPGGKEPETIARDVVAILRGRA
jgi:AcrR family transcriptional regulator